MATWPSTLPQRLRQVDYQDSLGDGVLRTEMDAGPTINRLRFSAVSLFVQGTIVVSSAQRTTLDAFYRTTLNGGADEFDWVHPHTGVAASVVFMAPPSYTNNGARWIVTLALEFPP